MAAPQSRRGPEPILGAAAAKLAMSTLEHLLAGTVTTRGVAAEAGVSPGTVSHHFPLDDATHGETSLGRAAAEHALLRLHDEALGLEDRVLDALEQLQRLDGDVAAHDLAEALAHDDPAPARGPVATDLGHEASVVARLLHAAAAPRDERARERLDATIEAVVAMRADAYEAALRALGRRPVGGLSTTDLARLTLAVKEGLQLLHRHRPEPAATLYATSVVRLLAALTEPDDHAARIDALDSLLPLPRQAELRGAALDRVRRAAVAAYDDGGWDAVTISRVARRANVPRATLVARLGDRHGLASLVWARHVPRIERAISRATGDAHERMRVCLSAITGAAVADRALTSAFLHGVFAYTAAHGPPDPQDAADPRTLVPLPLVIERLLAAAPEVLAEEWRSGQGRRDAASMLNNSALLLCVTRPTMEPEEAARRIFVTTYAGMCRDGVADDAGTAGVD